MMPTPVELKWLAGLSVLLAAWLTWAIRSDYAVEKGLGRVWRIVEDFISQSLMLMMVLTACVQVLARYVLPSDMSLPWTEEAGRLVMVWLALWGAAVLQRTDEHICMTALFSALGAAGQRVLLIVSDLVTIGVLTPITLWGWQNARSLDIMSSISLGLPLSIFAYSVPVSCALMIVYSIRLLIGRFRGEPARTRSAVLDV
jgi:TRAP-type C4-dicarboxylate transport system permease small subunit